MRGLDDPRIHEAAQRPKPYGLWLLRVIMDCRVKPTGVRHEFCLRKCTALILLRFSWLRII